MKAVRAVLPHLQAPRARFTQSHSAPTSALPVASIVDMSPFYLYLSLLLASLRALLTAS